MTAIRVPFTYTASVLEKRKRNPETRYFDEWIEVELRDAEADDAPVALRWHDEVPAELPFSDRDRWGAFPSDGVCETRWLDGSHWSPCLAGEPRSGGAERMGVAELERLCSAADDGGNPLMLHYGRSGNGPLVPEDYRSVEDCTRDQQVERIMAKARELAVIDGIVWKRTAEPVCYLSAWVDYGHSYQAPIKMLPADSPAIKDRTAAYRADRFDEACEAAFLRQGHGEADSVNLHRRVEVLIPGSLRYRDEEQALLSVSGRLIERLATRPLKEVPARLAASWHVLREAWEDEGPGLQGRCEAVEAALAGLAADCAEGSDLRRDAERVLDRWRSRPIMVDEETEAAPGPRP